MPNSKDRRAIDVREVILHHQQVIDGLDPLVPEICRLAEGMTNCVLNGGKVCWMGNGGSAADSQHLAAELVGRFARERRALAAIAFTTDTSILTSVGNDYGFEAIFSRQVEALCQPQDMLVGISTSGNSENVLAAIRRAKEMGVHTVGLTGRDGGRICGLVDQCLRVPATDTARIQEAHILIGHILCAWVEAASLEGRNDG